MLCYNKASSLPSSGASMIGHIIGQANFGSDLLHNDADPQVARRGCHLKCWLEGKAVLNSFCSASLAISST